MHSAPSNNVLSRVARLVPIGHPQRETSHSPLLQRGLANRRSSGGLHHNLGRKLLESNDLGKFFQALPEPLRRLPHQKRRRGTTITRVNGPFVSTGEESARMRRTRLWKNRGNTKLASGLATQIAQDRPAKLPFRWVTRRARKSPNPYSAGIMESRDGNCLPLHTAGETGSKG